MGSGASCSAEVSDFVDSPIVTFVGTLVAVAALAITLIQWPRRKLWWEVVQFAPIVEVGSDPKATMQFDGQQWRADEVGELVIEVLNSGNQNIEAEHYTRPLTFEFSDEAQVLVAEVLYEEPDGIGASVYKGSNTVTLEPVLLNAGDIVGLRMLIVRAQWINSDGRIASVKKIQRGAPLLRSANLMLLATITNICMGPAIIFPQLLPPPLLGVARALLVAGLILAGLGMWLNYREARRWKRRVQRISQLPSTAIIE